jgi:FMN phosphatase YigB (HAD superfamily)
MTTNNMKIIFDYNRTLYDPDTDNLYPGVNELLERLAKKHQLYLITKPTLGKESQLERLGIKSYFERTMIIEKKTPEVFRTLIGGANEAIVVGDRIREEIKIGNSLQFTTVWVRQGAYAKEIPRHEGEEPHHIVRNTAELQKVLLLDRHS